MKINFKKIGTGFLVVFGIILLFTLGDYLIHLLKEEYSVPSRYFTNKIIYGTLIGFVTYLFVMNKKLWTKTIVFSAVVAVLLQVRYALEGYNYYFLILFLIIHFLILVPISYLGFKFLKRK